jgi:hypothetical protein
MCKNRGIPFIGTRGGLTGYWRANMNVVRAASNLTGERVKKDPAFQGFRKSGNRMKEASPIAASLYNQIPLGKKEYKLYRILTGEALKMIKLGLDKAIITEELQKTYIDPIINQPANRTKQRVKKAHRSINLISYYIPVPAPVRTRFLSKRYQCRTKSRSSPLFNGLDLDLVAYG